MKFTNFKINDRVKYSDDYSCFMTYGKVVKVTTHFVDIKTDFGIKRVNKKYVNFD